VQAEELARVLAERGAMQRGHFRLSSGRHSDRFVAKFRLLEDPVLVERIAQELAARVRSLEPTVVVSAAVGGIVLGYELGRQLGTKAIFVEKDNGVPLLRRGFTLTSSDRVVAVEDVVTTGKSLREVLAVVTAAGATAVAAAIVVRREPQTFGVATETLLDVPTVSYEPAACPQCAAGESLVEPGSRFLR